MIPHFGFEDGQTPLTTDERLGLIPDDISTHGELNAVEAANILDGEHWAFSRHPSATAIVAEEYLSELHRRMFGRVWRWAGEYRQSNKTIGVPYPEIRIEMRNLVRDVGIWLERKIYPSDELAVRFHNRLLWVHPFVNGNGRHGRLAADRLVLSLGQPRFTWGSNGDLHGAGNLRATYIAAQRAADNSEIGNLLAFARS